MVRSTKIWSQIILAACLTAIWGCDQEIVHDGRTYVNNFNAAGVASRVISEGNGVSDGLKGFFLRPGRNSLSNLTAAEVATGVLFGVLDDQDKPCRGLSLIIAPSRGFFGKSDHQASEILFDRDEGETENDAVFFTCQGDDGEIHDYELSLGTNQNNKSIPQGTAESIAIENGTSYLGQIVATDGDDDTLTFEVIKPGRLGSLSLDEGTGEFSYTARQGAFGFDEVAIEVFDGKHSHEVPLTFRVVASVWQHPINPFDVNSDEQISELDAQLVINFLNRRRSINQSFRSLSAQTYYDTNGDRRVTPLDALYVINRINRGEETVPPTPFSFTGDAEFETSTPTITWSGATDDNPILYSLSISKTSSCENPLIEYNPSSTLSQIIDPLPEGEYFACVKARDIFGNEAAATNSPWRFSINYKARAASAGMPTLPQGAVQKIHDARRFWCGGGFESVWNGSQLFLWGGYAQDEALGQQVMIDREHLNLCQQGLMLDTARDEVIEIPPMPERAADNAARFQAYGLANPYSGATIACPPGVPPHRTIEVCPKKNGNCPDHKMEEIYLCTSTDPYRLRGKGRMGHSMIWNGVGFVVWGGHRGHANLPGQQFQYWTYSLNDGMIFNPASGEWSPLNDEGAPRPRTGHVAAYLPQLNKMLVYGGWDTFNARDYDDLDLKEDKLFGRGNAKVALADGALYNFTTDTWEGLPPGGPPVLAESELQLTIDGDGNAVFNYLGDHKYYILEAGGTAPRWVIEVR